MAIGTNIGAHSRHQHAHVHAHAAATAAHAHVRAIAADPATTPTATTTAATSNLAPATSAAPATGGCSMMGGGAATTAGGGATPLARAIQGFLSAVGSSTGGTTSAAGATAGAATLGATAPAAATGAAAAPAAGGGGTAGAQATGTGAALLGQVARTAAGSSLAVQVLNALGQHGARIDVMDDAAFNAKFPGAGGVYLPQEDRIVLPRSAANDPQKLSLVLVHEGTHWLQDHIGTGKLDSLGGPLAQALQGASALATGTGGPNSKDVEWHDEAQAYLVESMAAHQLGVRDPGLGSDARTGATLTYAQTLARVKAEPLYR